MSAEVAGKLREARWHITQEERWIQDGWAEDENGERCEADSPDAIRFCAMGATFHVGSEEAARRLDATATLLGYRSSSARPTVLLNDSGTTTHADVLALFDLAIEVEEATS